MNDQFELYDLEVTVAGDPKTFVCGHVTGPAFTVVGENLIFREQRKFSLYALWPRYFHYYQ